MSGEVEVSAARVRSAGFGLQQVADRFTDAVQAFQAEIQAFGEPWGGDEIGMIIGVSHGAVFEAALECFQSNAEELTGYGENLTAVAENHANAEEQNEVYVNRISELL